MEQNFRKFILKSPAPAGSVAQVVKKQSEAFKGPIPQESVEFEVGGSVQEAAATPKAVSGNPTAEITENKSNKVDVVVVTTLIVVGSLILYGFVKILNDREMYESGKNTHSKS